MRLWLWIGIALLILVGWCIGTIELAHGAPLGTVTWAFTVSPYQVGPLDPSIPCMIQEPSDTLDTVVECELALWRFAAGDTLLLRFPCQGGDSMNVVTQIEVGTMGQAMLRSKDASNNWSCFGNSYVFVVPYAEFTPGLFATFFADSAMTQVKDTRSDLRIDFNWGQGQPTPKVTTDTFAVKWVGYLRAGVGGIYTFRVVVNDAGRLQVGDTRVFDDYATGDSEHSIGGDVQLYGGALYPITVEMFERRGSARMTLLWTQPGMPEEVVPASALTQ